MFLNKLLEGQSMDLRKDIESLAIWFVLATIIMFVANLFLTKGDVQNIELLKFPLSKLTLMELMATFGLLSSLIDNIAVGAWLFQRAKSCGYKKWLWAAFGLAGSLVGGALFLLARAYETWPSNKYSQQDGAKDAPPLL